MIYCVVPKQLEGELYDRLVAYYEDEPNVTVIVDRRGSERRSTKPGGGKRKVRDRRRARIPGTFPPVGPPRP